MNEKDRDYCARLGAAHSELMHVDRHTEPTPTTGHRHPLVLAHVNIYKGDRLAPCHPSGQRIVSLGYYTVAHWDDTWVYYDECRRANGETTAKGSIDWLYYRVIAEGREKPTNSDPSVLKLKKGE